MVVKWNGVTKYHLYVFSAGEFRYRGHHVISPDGYIDDVPIEDFGDFLLSAEPLTPQQAWDNYWKACENEVPY